MWSKLQPAQEAPCLISLIKQPLTGQPRRCTLAIASPWKAVYCGWEGYKSSKVIGPHNTAVLQDPYAARVALKVYPRFPSAKAPSTKQCGKLVVKIFKGLQTTSFVT